MAERTAEEMLDWLEEHEASWWRLAGENALIFATGAPGVRVPIDWSLREAIDAAMDAEQSAERDDG